MNNSFRTLIVSSIVIGALFHHTATGAEPESDAKTIRLKLMTYNIRVGKGGGEWNNDPKRVDLEPVAKLVEQQGPDFVGLQEMDRFRKRTALADQPQWLKERLQLPCTFQAAYVAASDTKTNEEYGIALLSRWNVAPSERIPLFKPDYSKTHPEYPDYYSEQRALLHTIAQVDGRPIHVFVTHLGLTADQREKQIAQIIETAKRYNGPKILFGDFNAEPNEPAMEKLSNYFQDALAVMKTPLEQRKSYPAGEKSTEAIDYIFLSQEFHVLNASVLHDKTLASDHNPVVAEVQLLK